MQSDADVMDEDMGDDGSVGGDATMAAEYEDGDEGDNDVSDADSDFLELQADIARLDESRHAFLSEHLGPDYQQGRETGQETGADERGEEEEGGGGRVATTRRRRGPRKAAAPTGEVKLRLAQAHQLFMDHRYEEALEALHEIIRVNAETYAAWTLLASINEDLGRRDEAMMAKMFAAHLEPKRVAGWLSTADYALAGAAEAAAAGTGTQEEAEEEEERRLQNLQIARLCYSGAIRADKDNVAARLGKANVCLEFGQATNAATEYVRVLKRRPYALQVVRNLAEASYDSVRGEETIRAALAAYARAIAHLRRLSAQAGDGAVVVDLPDGESFSWMDVTIYVELFAAMARFAEAVAVLKELARWLLGRGVPDEDALWGHQVDDDCEWDRDDSPRRLRVAGFQPGRYPPAAYGEGLPVDLRAKLAIYRLKLGHEEEAIEHLAWIDPREPTTADTMALFPHLLKDVGAELFAAKRAELALLYFELYRRLNREAGAVGGGGGGGGDAAEYNQYGDRIVSESYAVLAAAAPADEDADALVLQGRCNLELHDHAAAEECFLAAIEADEENIDARIELAKMYEKVQEKEQAFILVNEALSLEAQQGGQEGGPEDGGGGGDDNEDSDVNDDDNNTRKRSGLKSLETGAYRVFLDDRGKVVRRRRKTATATAGGTSGKGAQKLQSSVVGGGEVRHRRRRRRRRRRPLQGHAKRFFASPEDRAAFESETSSRLRARYQLCQDVKARADAGDGAAAAQWMGAAQELIDDFRSFREFYAWDKYVQFLGYNNFLNDRSSGQLLPAKQRDLTAMAERLHQNLAPDESTTPPQLTARREYRGIPFDDWLALFLDYALSLAHAGRSAEAYAVCQSAHDSTVYREDDSMFLIHLTWAACALRADDAETCVAVARFFMRDRPFTTDCYRLYGVLCRLCRAPSVWFHSSPAQKYILRQIRQRDEVLQARSDLDPAARAAGLDVCLLVMYGHILLASTSYQVALNYYQRALAIDPRNPIVNLSIALAYVHWALKRQAGNRQYQLMQGVHFLFCYADARLRGHGTASVHARREVHFNIARTYHLLGLHGLAAEFYDKVLAESDGGDGGDSPDLRTEAAYNLRTYYLLAGNHTAALRITRAHLVM